MSLHPSDEEAIDTIDAMIFNGYSLHDKENIAEMHHFIERWTAKLKVIADLVAERDYK